MDGEVRELPLFSAGRGTFSSSHPPFCPPFCPSALSPCSLTALGTGVLMAADAAGLCPAPWAESASFSMTQPSGQAARLLRAAGATACTDVTGFGLVGHLAEMVAASNGLGRPDGKGVGGVGAVVDAGAVGALPGALDCYAGGRAAPSLLGENARLGIAAVANFRRLLRRRQVLGLGGGGAGVDAGEGVDAAAAMPPEDRAALRPAGERAWGSA